MTDLKKTSHKKLAKLLLETDDINIIEEMARRINLGLIPLALIGFENLSNKKLKRLETLTLSDWATKELWKREKDGRIPSGKIVTLEEIKELYSKKKQKQVS